MKIDKRLELEMRGKKPDQVMELNLDNCRINCDDELEVLTSNFTALESLSMINSNISSLEQFPELPCLRKLELSDNRISGGLEKLKGCAKLSQLSLSGNKIKDFSDLEALKSLKNLKSLDLFNCEVTNHEEYRVKVFEILEQITYLDGFDREDNEAEEEDDDIDDGDVDEDEDDDDDDDDDDEGEDEDGVEEVGLDYLTKENLDDEDDEDDEFDAEGDEDDEVVEEGVEVDEDDDDDDDDDDEEEEEDQQVRGQKRKHEEEEEEA
ncbi:acidic leucine-rich nuclear phosphoprotein 32 family member E-like isoform X1 [Haliotis rubra]|uniref:acidic leucine-rich nuclear phosphoprotein 32 family member E-like isoform X1 n=2 Tax=Haliotis rubra TaxID=36100 RepID=UPI001EE5F5F3|nr:acidic leucine-rich nuclear phosphoprotein 32 family member E-like isoform X1 [Haliotis rubra]